MIEKGFLYILLNILTVSYSSNDIYDKNHRQENDMKQIIQSNHRQFKKRAKPIYDSFPKPSKKKTEIEEASLWEKISNRLKLPPDILVGAPLVSVIGRNQLCIENYKGIIEYQETFLKIQAKSCKICIEGKKLNIDYFIEDEMRISGMIQHIYYQL